MKLITELAKNTPLPVELWLKIFYEHKGFITPSALIIKNHMKDNKLIEYTQLAYYVIYENLLVKDISESLLDISEYHITKSLINTDQYMIDEENRYEDFWTGYYWEITNGIIINGDNPQPESLPPF